MRAGLLGLPAVAALAAVASAQVDAPGSFPVFSTPLERTQPSETYRRLPFHDVGNEIRIEVSADLLYSFEDAKMRLSASDLLAQAANLIYERAKSPVRIECRSDRAPAAAAQKLADACAAAAISGQGGEGHQREIRKRWCQRAAARPARPVRAATAASDQGADRVCEDVIARSPWRRSNQICPCHSLDCFAPLAMTRLTSVSARRSSRPAGR